MLTLGVKRKIKLDVELQKLNVNDYKHFLRKLKNIELLTEKEFEILIEQLKKPTKNTEYQINDKDIKVNMVSKEKDIFFDITVYEIEG